MFMYFNNVVYISSETPPPCTKSSSIFLPWLVPNLSSVFVFYLLPPPLLYSILQACPNVSGCGAFLTLLMCVPLLNFFPPNSCFLVIAFSLSLFSKPWRWGKGKSRTGSIFRKRICMLQTDLWNSVCFKTWPNVACIAEKFQDWYKNEPFSKLEVVLTEPEWARAFQQNSCVKINLIRAIHYLIKHSWKLWKNLLKIPKEFEPKDMLGAPHPNK